MVSRIAFLAWGPGVYTPKASDAIWSSWRLVLPVLLIDGQNYLPVDPNAPAPRASPKSATKSGRATGNTTNWPIRSPL